MNAYLQRFRRLRRRSWVTVPAAEVQAAFMAGLGFAYAKVASAEELLAGM